MANIRLLYIDYIYNFIPFLARKEAFYPSDFTKLVELWKIVISVVISFSSSLLPALEGGLKNKETVRSCVETIRSIMSAIQGTLKIQLKAFSDEVVIRV